MASQISVPHSTLKSLQRLLFIYFTNMTFSTPSFGDQGRFNPTQKSFIEDQVLRLQSKKLPSDRQTGSYR